MDVTMEALGTIVRLVARVVSNVPVAGSRSPTRTWSVVCPVEGEGR